MKKSEFLTVFFAILPPLLFMCLCVSMLAIPFVLSLTDPDTYKQKHADELLSEFYEAESYKILVIEIEEEDEFKTEYVYQKDTGLAQINGNDIVGFDLKEKRYEKGIKNWFVSTIKGNEKIPGSAEMFFQLSKDDVLAKFDSYRMLSTSNCDEVKLSSTCDMVSFEENGLTYNLYEDDNKIALIEAEFKGYVVTRSYIKDMNSAENIKVATKYDELKSDLHKAINIDDSKNLGEYSKQMGNIDNTDKVDATQYYYVSKNDKSNNDSSFAIFFGVFVFGPVIYYYIFFLVLIYKDAKKLKIDYPFPTAFMYTSLGILGVSLYYFILRRKYIK